MQVKYLSQRRLTTLIQELIHTYLLGRKKKKKRWNHSICELARVVTKSTFEVFYFFPNFYLVGRGKMKMPLWGRVCLCIAILVSMEVPISRLHYQARIRNEVTPRKLELMDKHADLLDCTGMYVVCEIFPSFLFSSFLCPCSWTCA